MWKAQNGGVLLAEDRQHRTADFGQEVRRVDAHDRAHLRLCHLRCLRGQAAEHGQDFIQMQELRPAFVLDGNQDRDGPSKLNGRVGGPDAIRQRGQFAPSADAQTPGFGLIDLAIQRLITAAVGLWNATSTWSKTCPWASARCSCAVTIRLSA